MSNINKEYYRKKYKKNKKNKISYSKIVINILVLIVIILIILYIKNSFIDDYKQLKTDRQHISAFAIPERSILVLKELSDKYKIDFSETLSLYSLDNGFFEDIVETPTLVELEENFLSNLDQIKNKYKKVYPAYALFIKNILDDLRYFPVPDTFSGKFYDYNFNDSWGAKRNYNGARIHEGTDIMDAKNIRGYIPIVSMTDGVIENMGWNEYGGFRIGIRTENKNYFYYAHFDSFNENIKKGDSIKAGQLLGFMGDTGYSKKEGTVGNFSVHLHVGISPETKIFSDEFWINPYPFLILIEDTKFVFN